MWLTEATSRTVFPVDFILIRVDTTFTDSATERPGFLTQPRDAEQRDSSANSPPFEKPSESSYQILMKEK
jgi:hypothetical protein